MQELAQALGKPDWFYHDLPKMPPNMFKEFLDIVGEENIYWITFAEEPAHKGRPPLCRGQILLSPQGKERARQYTIKLEEKKAQEGSG